MVGICLHIFNFSHKEIFKSVSKRIILPYKVSEIKQWIQPYYWLYPLPKQKQTNKKNYKTIS